MLVVYLTISGKIECESNQRGHGSDVPRSHLRRSKQIMFTVILNVCCLLFRARRAVTFAIGPSTAFLYVRGN